MKSKFIILLGLPIMLGCNFVLSGMQGRNPTPVPSGTGPSHEAISIPASDTAPAIFFVLERIHTGEGNLSSQLGLRAAEASKEGLSPFIEFDATWCPPCQAVNESITSRDPQTMQAFDGIFLIRADVDEWGMGDGVNFKFDAIPVYFKLDENGQPSGDVIDGGAWGEDIPENFAPVLGEFFHRN